MGKKFMGKKSINGGIVKLMIALERLQKSLLSGRKLIPGIGVPPGHFAVIAGDDDDGELKRFVVPLSNLTQPSFLRLLEQAAEEYGFDRDGALMVPCRPCELERILAERWAENRDGGGDRWSFRNEGGVKSG